MPKLIQTERLELRPVSIADLEFKIAMETNAEIMAFIGAGEPRTIEQVQNGLNQYLLLEQQFPFLGQWVAREKSTGKDIGTLIIRHPATEEKVEGLEIGYSYLPEAWGKGFASEAAQGVILYSRQHMPDQKVVALVDAQNAASRRVLTKVGMIEAGEATYVNPVNGVKKVCLLMEY